MEYVFAHFNWYLICCISGELGASRTSDTEYRPGLSAGISGAGYLEDGRSVTSSLQSSNVAAITQALTDQAQNREQR